MIRITQQLELPLSLVTDAMAVFGRRGSGKTNTAAVIVESALDAGVQVIILDPKDEWYGLRSSRTGQSAGYSIPVLGGHCPDALPLGEHDAEALADLLVEQRLPAVICTQTLPSTAAEKRFARDFCARLLARKAEPKHRTPMLVVFEEARRFAPQRVDKDETKLLKAVVEIIRLGRTYGFGALLIDQRPASIHKDAMQIELLVTHQVTTPHDRKALKEWVQANDTEGREQEFLSSLAALEKGEAWFWAPAFDNLFQKVQVPIRKTFDASVTPGVDQADALPQRLASFDQSAFAQQLASTIEQKKANDPTELKRQLAEERTLRAAAESRPPEIDQDQVNRLIKNASHIRDAQWEPIVRRAEQTINRLQEQITRIRHATEFDGESFVPLDRPDDVPPPQPADIPPRNNNCRTVTHRNPARVHDNRASTHHSSLSGPERRVLNALAWWESIGVSRPDRQNVAILAGYTNVRSKGFANALGSLRSAEFLDDLELTDLGRSAASIDGPASLDDLHQRIFAELPPKQADLLRDVIAHGSISREELGNRNGYTNTRSKGLANGLGRLRSMGFIDYNGQQVETTDLLFPPRLS